jgi:hypothetical protein
MSTLGHGHGYSWRLVFVVVLGFTWAVTEISGYRFMPPIFGPLSRTCYQPATRRSVIIPSVSIAGPVVHSKLFSASDSTSDNKPNSHQPRHLRNMKPVRDLFPKDIDDFADDDDNTTEAVEVVQAAQMLTAGPQKLVTAPAEAAATAPIRIDGTKEESIGSLQDTSDNTAVDIAKYLGNQAQVPETSRTKAVQLKSRRRSQNTRMTVYDRPEFGSSVSIDAKFPTGENRDARLEANANVVSDMQLIFLGTSSCTPNSRRGVSCTAVKFKGET